MHQLNKRLSAFLLSAAFLTVPALSFSKTSVDTLMTVTNKVPGFKVLVSAEMLCGGTSDKNKALKAFPHDPVMPTAIPVGGTWKDCRLLASGYYDTHRTYKWGYVTVRVRDLKTDDFLVVHMKTVASESGDNTFSKVIEFNGHTFHLDLQHDGYEDWYQQKDGVKKSRLKDHITTSLTVYE